MIDNQAEALAALLDRHPRGLNPPARLVYGANRRTFEVASLQRWSVGGKDEVMGLVWASDCPACGQRWLQLSATRPSVLHEECHACRGERPLYDVAAARPDACEPRGKRRGRIETHIIEVMAQFGERDVVPVEEVVATAVASLPSPLEGQRDTRRQLVTRALQNMGKERDGVLSISGGNVVFYG